mgnify:CR=1 FL=1
MICLAIDTVGPACSAALQSGSDPAGLLAAESERIGRGHAERLMPMIEAVLGRAGRTYEDIGLVAVTTGPGSFTGVRIGISAARGLALALDIEACGISVLDVLAGEARAGSDAAVPLVSVLDAGRGDLFVQMLAYDGEVLLPAARLPAVEAAASIELKAGPDSRVGLFGSGAEVLKQAAGLSDGWTILGEADHADIAMLARMAADGAGQSPARPLYLRPPDAKPQTGKAVAHA